VTPTLRLLVAGLLALLLVACTREAMLQKIAAPEDQALARSAIADVAAARSGTLALKMVPPLGPQIIAAMPQMQPRLPLGTLRLVDARASTNLTKGGRTTNMIWEASDGGRYALVSTTVYRNGGDARLSELYLLPVAGPAESLFPLDFKGKSFSHYLFLLLTAAAVLLCLYGLVLAWRLPGLRRRWLWALGSLFGFAQVSIRWSDGDIFFKPVNVQLLGGFAAKAGLLVPWQVGFGIPVVAIVLIAKRIRGSDATESAPA
jgi:hypothetical protein